MKRRRNIAMSGWYVVYYSVLIVFVIGLTGDSTTEHRHPSFLIRANHTHLIYYYRIRTIILTIVSNCTILRVHHFHSSRLLYDSISFITGIDGTLSNRPLRSDWTVRQSSYVDARPVVPAGIDRTDRRRPRRWWNQEHNEQEKTAPVHTTTTQDPNVGSLIFLASLIFVQPSYQAHSTGSFVPYIANTRQPRVVAAVSIDRS